MGCDRQTGRFSFVDPASQWSRLFFSLLSLSLSLFMQGQRNYYPTYTQQELATCKQVKEVPFIPFQANKKLEEEGRARRVQENKIPFKVRPEPDRPLGPLGAIVTGILLLPV